MVESLYRIHDSKERIDTVSFILSNNGIPAELRKTLLLIGLEAVQKIDDQEALFHYLAHAAALADPKRPSGLLQAAPILSGSGTYYSHEYHWRKCVNQRLEWTPSGSELPKKHNSFARCIDENWLEMSDSRLVSEFINELKYTVETEKRSVLLERISKFIEELSLRGYPSVAGFAAKAYHDCYRWWP